MTKREPGGRSPGPKNAEKENALSTHRKGGRLTARLEKKKKLPPSRKRRNAKRTLRPRRICLINTLVRRTEEGRPRKRQQVYPSWFRSETHREGKKSGKKDSSTGGSAEEKRKRYIICLGMLVDESAQKKGGYAGRNMLPTLVQIRGRDSTQFE